MDDFKTAEHPWLGTIATLLENYSPVDNFEEADKYMTTGDIVNAVSAHFGVEVPAHQVFQCMTYLEYKASAQGGQLEWMLKEKS